MSDLISRSEVNDVIDELEVYTSGRSNIMKVEVSVLQLRRFINKLKNIPTAYNADKVVEQLDKVCNDTESNPRKEAYLKALEDYHRLISEECKFMLIKYNPYALHLKEYNDKILEQLKVGGNIELSEHSKSQGNRTGKQKATIEAESKTE